MTKLVKDYIANLPNTDDAGMEIGSIHTFDEGCEYVINTTRYLIVKRTPKTAILRNVDTGQEFRTRISLSLAFNKEGKGIITITERSPYVMAYGKI